ncbi:conserved hypothetical protein (plasmid) [Rhodococcus jostii RHA1]|uniref:Uncharacterized protein n=1 Tax=Rhodococcus jostii (strain RHA1) TaxID=101510 RepID=Q0RZ69_RHOJR|nr:conserved hypothetical protein [Rhodococcus jostii RHA1]
MLPTLRHHVSLMVVVPQWNRGLITSLRLARSVLRVTRVVWDRMPTPGPYPSGSSRRARRRHRRRIPPGRRRGRRRPVREGVRGSDPADPDEHSVGGCCGRGRQRGARRGRGDGGAGGAAMVRPARESPVSTTAVVVSSGLILRPRGRERTRSRPSTRVIAFAVGFPRVCCPARSTYGRKSSPAG